ncbi:MAG: glutathione peroxidase [Eubacteriales bacterium]
MSLYDSGLKAVNMKGDTVDFSQYKGKVLLIVNTASKCGYTKQFAGLEEVFEKYKDKDFLILGFPCNQFAGQDPADNDKILEFCQVNYGVTFPMFQKISVNGRERHELYKYLLAENPVSSKRINWNFEKFLVDRDGKVVNRFVSKDTPEDIAAHIEKLL